MTRRDRARLIRSLTWPVALLVVGTEMTITAQMLARLDGFRLYGLVQALGEIVGVIGLVWLISMAAMVALRRDGTGSRPWSADE